MNDCRCHLGSAISQHGDRGAGCRCLPVCSSLRHLLSIAIQGLHGEFMRRIFSAADLCELPADFRGGFCEGFRSQSCGGFLSGPKPCELQLNIAEEIKKAKVFKEIVVSTDSEKIKKISKEHGAKIYFDRPKKLCSDSTTTFEIIKHCIDFLKKKKKLNYICCIYPTAVLLDSKHIKKSLQMIKKKYTQKYYPTNL